MQDFFHQQYEVAKERIFYCVNPPNKIHSRPSASKKPQFFRGLDGWYISMIFHPLQPMMAPSSPRIQRSYDFQLVNSSLGIGTCWGLLYKKSLMTIRWLFFKSWGPGGPFKATAHPRPHSRHGFLEAKMGEFEVHFSAELLGWKPVGKGQGGQWRKPI